MPRLRITSMFVAAALLVPAIAAADETRFSVIDAATVKIDPGSRSYRELVIPGTVEGSRLTSVFLSDEEEPDVQQQCFRLATLVLSKPGKYQLEVEYARWSDDRGPRVGCTLVRTP